MRHSFGIAVAWTVGVTAFLAPIVLSVHLARRQSLNGEFSLLHGYAQNALYLADRTAQQMSDATQQLEQAHLPPCSPQEIALMRRIAVNSDYLQAVGRVSQNQLVCSSLGVNQLLSLGPADFVQNTGSAVRTAVRLPLAGGKPLLVVERGGFAAFVSPSLPISVPTDGPGFFIAIFSVSTGRLFTGTGPIRPACLAAARKSAHSDLVAGHFLASVARSSNFDIAALAAAPQSLIERKVREDLYPFVTVGILCGLALAGAVFYLSRIRLSMPGLLRAAARRNEFFVEYQPVVDLATRRWMGAEALVRWRRDGYVVFPDVFIPIAEATGVIPLITRRVLAQVAADLPAILRRHPDFHVGFNLSAPDLHSPETLELLKQLLRTSGAPPTSLVVEATERGFLQGETSRELVSSIRGLGMAVAIDDFGTGYSSLSRLTSLKLTHLKIDKSFIETIGTDGATSQVVMHIIEMTHALDLRIVAEGVETEEQARFLAERGVHFAQGWLFARPMPLQDLLDRMASAPADTVPIVSSV